MVLRILGGVLLLIVALVSIAASWFFRPWSDYSPARVQAAFQPENIIDVSLNMAS